MVGWWSGDSHVLDLAGFPNHGSGNGLTYGPGKADSAFWRPSTGEWFILRSEDSSYYSVPFGANGDLPVPGDYDGDGRFDTAVFRPSGSTWYIPVSYTHLTLPTILRV